MARHKYFCSGQAYENGVARRIFATVVISQFTADSPTFLESLEKACRDKLTVPPGQVICFTCVSKLT
jgi:hypothetical protein